LTDPKEETSLRFAIESVLQLNRGPDSAVGPGDVAAPVDEAQLGRFRARQLQTVL
jgi:hypothetical protein